MKELILELKKIMKDIIDNNEEDLRIGVKAIIDNIEEEGIVKDTRFKQSIYELILLDIEFECWRLAKEYMSKEGVVLEVKEV